MQVVTAHQPVKYERLKPPDILDMLKQKSKPDTKCVTLKPVYARSQKAETWKSHLQLPDCLKTLQYGCQQ